MLESWLVANGVFGFGAVDVVGFPENQAVDPIAVIALAFETFDEAEYLAAVREIERTGGAQIDDLIAELERRVNGSA